MRQIRGAVFALILVAMLLPWLNPVAPGPSPTIVPWLVSFLATAALLPLFSLLALLPGIPFAGQPDSAQAWRSFVQTVAASWVIAGVASCMIGLLQYFGVASHFAPWFSSAPLGEAFANLRQRNHFASLTNIALAALIWLAVKSFHDRDSNPQPTLRRHTWMLLAAALLAVGNAASSSRTGLLQLFLLVALCGVWGLWRKRLVVRLLIVPVLAYGVAMVALPWLSGFDLSLHGMAARLLAGDEACASRITLWSNVLHLIAQKPWLGWGWGELGYAHYSTLYDGPRFCDILDNSHNLPLQLAVELGIPVALLVCGGFLCWVLRQRPWRETDPRRQLAWSVLAVILLHSMLEYPLWYGPFQMAFGLCLGLLWRPEKIEQGMVYAPKNTINRQFSRVMLALCATFLIACVVYAAWDYRRISQIYLVPEQRDAAYRDDTLAKIQGSWLFSSQVHFAQLLLTPLTPDKAQWTFDTATALLHYSAEPRIIEKTIESAVMLGRDGEALAHLVRYQAAFPADHARWVQKNAESVSGLQP